MQSDRHLIYEVRNLYMTAIPKLNVYRCLRTDMAKALMNHFGPDRYQGYSSGEDPGTLLQEAIKFLTQLEALDVSPNNSVQESDQELQRDKIFDKRVRQGLCGHCGLESGW